MSLSFGLERLQISVQQLAAGSGSIQDRVREAYAAISTLVPNEDLNFKAQKEFAGLSDSIHSNPSPTAAEATKMAATILNMFIAVLKAEAVEEFSRKNLSIK
jgi:hypothetical protein